MSKAPIPNLEAASFIGKHSVAFLLPDQGATGGVRLKASGSLVTFAQRYFISTATHVWAALRKSPIINCSAIADLSHDFNFPREALTDYSLDDNLEKSLGAGKELEEFDADLTLLELHPADRRRIEARSSFYPLEREPHPEMNDWVMIGSPGVLAHKDAREINTLSFEIRSHVAASGGTPREHVLPAQPEARADEHCDEHRPDGACPRRQPEEKLTAKRNDATGKIAEATTSTNKMSRRCSRKLKSHFTIESPFLRHRDFGVYGLFHRLLLLPLVFGRFKRYSL
jgi:hypothetical protein